VLLGISWVQKQKVGQFIYQIINSVIDLL